MEKIAFIQNNTFFENVRKVHFIGIGGISQSALSMLSKSFGFDVTGSDIVESNETKKLARKGIKVYIGHDASNICDDVDLVVYTGAVGEDNIEYKTAKAKHIRLVERSEYLGQIAKLYSNVIAVAGSHGKTTTTAMIGHIFKVAKLNPTIHLGGESIEWGNLRIGDNKYFITEACEYRNSMSQIVANTAVVTNVDNDHLDYYKTKQNLVKAFQNFTNNATDSIVIGSERNFRKVSRTQDVYSVGLNNNQRAYATNISKTKKGYKFDVVIDGNKTSNFAINMLGKHNIRNAMYAITVAYIYGIDLKVIRKALKSYKGTMRRYELIGKYRKIPLMSDYAHHPTEIRNSINGLKSHYQNILIIFQPHTYSRTKILLKEFKTAFLGAKSVIIYKTYPAREPYDKHGDEVTMYNAISNKSKYMATDLDGLQKTLAEITSSNHYDLIVYMGAGDLPLHAKSIK